MSQIDLDPTRYRVKGAKLIRYLSIRPFKRAATMYGIWAAAVFVAQGYFGPEPTWLYMVAAFGPIVGLVVTWFLLGGEDAVEPPPQPPRAPTKPKERPYSQWQQPPTDYT